MAMEVTVLPKPASGRLKQQASFGGQLTLLSFNTWGSPWRSKDYASRLEKQAEYFRNSGRNLDVVLLQDAYSEDGVCRLTAAAAEAGLSHAAAFDGGVVGSGLLVLSRFPITDLAFRPFQLRGAPGEVWEALAGKGVGYARAQLPGGAPLHLFTAALHANPRTHTLPDRTLPDVKVPADAWAPYRTAQLVEAAAFMRPLLAPALAAGELVFVGGSWAATPDSLEMVLLAELLPPGLADCWTEVHGEEGEDDAAGHTLGSWSNVYTEFGYDSVHGRVDSVWSNARVVAAETVLTRVPHSRLSYSDHHGVLVVASTSPPTPTVTPAAAAATAIPRPSTGARGPAPAPAPASAPAVEVTATAAAVAVTTPERGGTAVKAEPVLEEFDGVAAAPGAGAGAGPDAGTETEATEAGLGPGAGLVQPPPHRLPPLKIAAAAASPRPSSASASESPRQATAPASGLSPSVLAAVDTPPSPSPSQSPGPAPEPVAEPTSTPAPAPAPSVLELADAGADTGPVPESESQPGSSSSPRPDPNPDPEVEPASSSPRCSSRRPSHDQNEHHEHHEHHAHAHDHDYHDPTHHHHHHHQQGEEEMEEHDPDAVVPASPGCGGSRSTPGRVTGPGFLVPLVLDAHETQFLPQSPHSPPRVIRGPGPVAEARVSPAPMKRLPPSPRPTPDPSGPGPAAAGANAAAKASAGAAAPPRRARLLALALDQLRTGQADAAARLARSGRLGVLCALVVLACVGAQLYCIMAASDHVAVRLCGAVAVAGGLVGCVAGLLQLPAALADRAARRGFRQLARTVEAWHWAAGGGGGGGAEGGGVGRGGGAGKAKPE